MKTVQMHHPNDCVICSEALPGTRTFPLCGRVFRSSFLETWKNFSSLTVFTVEGNGISTELARAKNYPFCNSAIQTKKTCLNDIIYKSKLDVEGNSAADATICIKREKNGKQYDRCFNDAQQTLAETITRDQGSK